MASDPDGGGGVYFDDDYRIRVFDLKRLQASQELKSNATIFLDKAGQLQDKVQHCLSFIDNQAKRVEEEKLRAIGLRNRAAAAEEESKRRRKELRLLLSEKQEELERLQVEEQSLVKLRQEQELTIAKLSDSGAGGLT